MSPDYAAAHWWVRRSRLMGWGLTLIMTLGVVLALGCKIAEISERRAMDATRENLAASLSNLAAEQMARNQAVGQAWSKRNPFVLLRWQQDNYCGELAAGDEAQAGCWYWLPQQAWVLYRPRFAAGWARQGREMWAWRWQVAARQASATSQPVGGPPVVEFETVPVTEMAAQGFSTEDDR